MSPSLTDSRRALRWSLIRLARRLGLGRLWERTRLAWWRHSRSHVDLGGVRLRVGAHLSPAIQRAIYRGYYEAPELACLRRARRVGSERVFTFEANPALRPLIEETFRLNGVAPWLEP